jgi:hypothetical protein
MSFFVNFWNHIILFTLNTDLARAEALTRSAADQQQPQPQPEPLAQPLPQQRTYAIATVVESPELGQVRIVLEFPV